MKRQTAGLKVLGFSLALTLSLSLGAGSVFFHPARAQVEDSRPPDQTVKLIFIHHSTGENWLADGYGDLGMALGENNYFVSDTNYGWGPDGIGDRTDILNWPEWFRSPETPRYMEALFSESGQHSPYTRSLPDPGGENEIVMFKSCFPNSELQGSPDDPPAPGDELSISSAKHIYNDLLEYFVTRPDKLFVVITAPPLQDVAYASNARAFNTWLVRDWLRENNYPHANVAVFDFYNVLTHPDNHHRFAGGGVEYITSHGSSTLFYPTEDDHPSPDGSRKATAEFVSLLNVFYHRWRAEAPLQPPPVEATQPPAESPEAIAPAPLSGSLIDDFESGPPPDTDGWNPYWDESTTTSIACGSEPGMAKSGSAALHVSFDVQADSWATCAIFFDQPRDLRSAGGLSLYVHAAQPAQVFDVNVYEGPDEERQSYLFSVETTQAMVDGWVYLELPWEMLLRAEWESQAGEPLLPDQVAGFAIGFGTFPDTPNSGELWLDDLQLLGPAIQAIEATQPQVGPTEGEPAEPPEPTEAAEIEGAEEGGGGFCPGTVALGMIGLAAAAFTSQRRRRL